MRSCGGKSVGVSMPIQTRAPHEVYQASPV